MKLVYTDSLGNKYNEEQVRMLYENGFKGTLEVTVEEEYEEDESMVDTYDDIRPGPDSIYGEDDPRL